MISIWPIYAGDREFLFTVPIQCVRKLLFGYMLSIVHSEEILYRSSETFTRWLVGHESTRVQEQFSTSPLSLKAKRFDYSS